MLDGGQLWLDMDRLVAACHSITVSADHPLLEFECASGCERFLVYPDAQRRQTAVNEILTQIQGAEEHVQVTEAARWLDDLPGNRSNDPVVGEWEDDSECSPYPTGTTLRARMSTAFAEWKRHLCVSSVDFVGNLMIIRDRDCVAYCPRTSDPGDGYFSLAPG